VILDVLVHPAPIVVQPSGDGDGGVWRRGGRRNATAGALLHCRTVKEGWAARHSGGGATASLGGGGGDTELRVGAVGGAAVAIVGDRRRSGGGGGPVADSSEAVR
jgi:hypothetical protein